MPQGRQSHLDAALTSSGLNGPHPYDPPPAAGTSAHMRQARSRGSLANRLSPFRSFHRVAETRPSALPIVALCAHGRRDCRDKPCDEEMAVTSFAPLRLAGFSDGPPRQSKQQCPPVGRLKSPEARPLRSEEDDSRKMEKHSWGQFLGISRVVSDTRHVTAQRCQIAVTGRFVELDELLGTQCF
jgi:hypothetical protein